METGTSEKRCRKNVRDMIRFFLSVFLYLFFLDKICFLLYHFSYLNYGNLRTWILIDQKNSCCQLSVLRLNKLGFFVKKYFIELKKVLAFYFLLWHNTNYDDAPFVLESSRTCPTKAKCGRLYPINPPRHPVEARACVLSTNSAPCGQRRTKCVDKLYRCWRKSTLVETTQIVGEPRISTKQIVRSHTRPRPDPLLRCEVAYHTCKKTPIIRICVWLGFLLCLIFVY